MISIKLMLMVMLVVAEEAVGGGAGAGAVAVRGSSGTGGACGPSNGCVDGCLPCMKQMRFRLVDRSPSMNLNKCY